MKTKALVLTAFAAIWLLPTLGCVDDYPYHTPEAPNLYGATSTRAFTSGESSTGATTEAAQDLPDGGPVIEDVEEPEPDVGGPTGDTN